MEWAKKLRGMGGMTSTMDVPPMDLLMLLAIAYASSVGPEKPTTPTSGSTCAGDER
jgi:hypothetical protein